MTEVEWKGSCFCGDSLCWMGLVNGRLRGGTFRTSSFGRDDAVQWWAKGPRGGNKSGGIEADLQTAKEKVEAAINKQVDTTRDSWYK